MPRLLLGMTLAGARDAWSRPFHTVQASAVPRWRGPHATYRGRRRQHSGPAALGQRQYTSRHKGGALKAVKRRRQARQRWTWVPRRSRPCLRAESAPHIGHPVSLARIDLPWPVARGPRIPRPCTTQGNPTGRGAGGGRADHVHDDRSATATTRLGVAARGTAASPGARYTGDAHAGRRGIRRSRQVESRINRRECTPPAATSRPPAPGRAARADPGARLRLLLLARLARGWRTTLLIARPDTPLRWHRQGFRLVWRARSATAAKRLQVSEETVPQIQRLAAENRL